MKTKLNIANRRDYPIRDGFPSGLEVLSVNGCSLRKIDSRILLLRRLVISIPKL